MLYRGKLHGSATWLERILYLHPTITVKFSKEYKFTIFVCFYYSAIVLEGKEVSTSFKLTPYRAGVYRVCATFRADMISGVRGLGGVQVSE